MSKIVISLGGSLIAPDTVDSYFLKTFTQLIDAYVKEGFEFIIVTGGGSVARVYQKAAAEVTYLEFEQLDWIGIAATQLNATLLKILFKGDAHEDILIDPSVKVMSNKPVLVASGWKPGWSTDYVAVKLAETYGAKKVINLSNVSHVYDRDPKKDRGAKPLEIISWSDFRRLIGDEWDPGANLPFDPIASKEAQRLGLKVIIANGRDIENVAKILMEDKYDGTLISD